jgi:glycosyltransferase involved in cell wall biosynthesis
MRIAYLSTFYPYRGGIAQFNASLYRSFEKENEIKAFTFTRQYPNFLFPGETQLVTEKDKVDKIPSERVLDTINPFTYFSAASKISKFNPDLMLTKFWMPFFAPSLGKISKALKKKGVKNISILDNVIPHEKRIGDIALTKYFLRQQSGFIVMSDTVRKDLLSLHPNAKYEMFPHPIYDHFGKTIPKEDALEKLNIPKDKKVLLFFGFIRDYKGLDILLKSMKLLPEDYHLIIAGEVYGSFDKYDKMIQEMNLASRITRAVKYISDSEVPVYFSAADVCVLPYKSATQSGIVSIAYQFNLPIISTDVGSLKEMIEPFNAGMILNSIDERTLADTISNYFANNMKANFQQNMNLYKEKYSWNNLAEVILELSRSL